MSETMRDRMQLLLFTHRKLHTGFPLVPKLMTLNGVTAVISHYLSEFSSYGPTMSKRYKLDQYCLKKMWPSI